VSNAYLLIAEMMGLVGLAAFGLVMAVVLGWALLNRRAAFTVAAGAAGVDGTALWLGAHAALGAALVVGLVDHYFFSMSFQSAGTLFWLIVALCLATTRLARQANGARVF
jgi:hypothetical protein